MAKLQIAIAFLALVAAASAAGCCNGADRKTVLRQWESVWKANFRNRAVLAKDIFQRFFAKYPDYKSLFARVKVDEPDSPEWSSHVTRIITGLDIALNLLSQPETLYKQLSHLSSQHVARVPSGFNPASFDQFEDALLSALNEVTSGFDRNAWSACYKYIAERLKSEF